MLNLSSNAFTGAQSRRSFLTMGTLGVGGLALSDVLRVRAQAGAKSATQETAVIFIWLAGGVSHLETYDMKPDAPSEYRGEFRPMRSNVSGIDVCEHLPWHAKCADKYTIIRSIAHDFSDHGGGSKRFLTGRIPAEPTGFVTDAPMVGSIVAKMREKIDVGLPNYVCGTEPRRNSVDTYGFGASYLGPKYHPFNVGGDPSVNGFRVQNLSLNQAMADRLDDRMTLLKSFDNLREDIDGSGVMQAMDSFNQQAITLMTGERARNAFDMAQEPRHVRDRYGWHAWGQRALLARRLVEAGCSFVTMVMEDPYVSGVRYLKSGWGNWDSHAVNCHMYEDGLVRLPLYDRAITALVEDLHHRGLTDKVMLVAAGEFGRSPRINMAKGRNGDNWPGREHWPHANSILMCGGGMRHGQIVGSTTPKGEHPHDRPLTPNDVWATVYHHLGIDTETTFPDHTGRPMPILPFGEPIRELL